MHSYGSQSLGPVDTWPAMAKLTRHSSMLPAQQESPSRGQVAEMWATDEPTGAAPEPDVAEVACRVVTAAARSDKSTRAVETTRAVESTRPLRRWRDWLIPRTILGMVMLILVASGALAASGVGLFSYYSFRRTESEDKINAKVLEVRNASAAINDATTKGKTDIEAALAPLRELQAGGDKLTQLLAKAAPAIYYVQTLDESGQPSVGSAFAIAADSEQTLLITSYSTVRASTRAPAPGISVLQGKDTFKATLHTWDESKDLALLMIPRKNGPKLTFAPADPTPALGSQIFAISGLGANGGSIVQGQIADLSASGLQHTTAIGPQFQGGPLVNAKGEVVAIASRSYSPQGFVPEAVWFAPPIRAACEKVLRCPTNEKDLTAGARR